TCSMKDVSIGAFTAGHRKEIDQLLSTVQQIGNFSDEAMAIWEGMGYLREHEVTAPAICLWAGYIDAYSPALDHPTSVRRMLYMGIDLQLSQLMHALVAAGAEGRMEVRQASQSIVVAIRAAA